MPLSCAVLHPCLCLLKVSIAKASLARSPAWTGQGWKSPDLFAVTLLCCLSLPPTELQAKLLSSEAEVKNKLLELDNVKGKLQDASSENMKLLERIKSIEALLEAGQMREAEKDRHLQVLFSFNWGGRWGGVCTTQAGVCALC